MAKIGYFDTIIDQKGNGRQATITVFIAGTQTLATIYANPEGTIQKGNPFQTDSQGRFQFFADAGKYDIKISGPGIITYTVQYKSLTDTTKFTELTDTPGNYQGQSGKIIKVNANETGLEFATEAGGGATTFLELTDTPSSYTGHEGKTTRVKSDATGLEFKPNTFLELTDTPSDYAGHGEKVVRVKADATGLEFATIQAASGVPVGAITAYGGTADPDGWLICDGRAISRTTYANLFAVIGTTYGAGDGSTTFNIPDLRQRFPLGKAASGTGSTMGESGGAINHSHSISAEASHTHSIDPPRVSTISLGGNTFYAAEGSTFATGDHYHDIDISAFNSGPGSAHTHTAGTANPPYLVVNYIIKY